MANSDLVGSKPQSPGTADTKHLPLFVAEPSREFGHVGRESWNIRAPTE